MTRAALVLSQTSRSPAAPSRTARHTSTYEEKARFGGPSPFSVSSARPPRARAPRSGGSSRARDHRPLSRQIWRQATGVHRRLRAKTGRGRPRAWRPAAPDPALPPHAPSRSPLVRLRARRHHRVRGSVQGARGGRGRPRLCRGGGRSALDAVSTGWRRCETPGCTESRLQRRSVTQSRVIRWNSQVVWLARVYSCEQVLTVPPCTTPQGETPE